ncbi:uncharacterized protein LOC134178807 [Corticium candelabrum]|uniref:uncharacterized protein LOC134178807 n=1 Tax=Corticium candelabrum TaxID=121492 RepID=UPI002E26862E|nr:uncharacterized protein LOC134178807 [Corticium candelabrum]
MGAFWPKLEQGTQQTFGEQLCSRTTKYQEFFTLFEALEAELSATSTLTVPEEILKQTLLLKGIEKKLNEFLQEVVKRNQLMQKLDDLDEDKNKFHEQIYEENLQIANQKNSVLECTREIHEQKTCIQELEWKMDEINHKTAAEAGLICDSKTLEQHLKMQIGDLKKEIRDTDERFQNMTKQVASCRETLTEHELIRREGIHFNVLVVHKDCPASLCQQMGEDLTGRHSNYSYSVLSWRDATPPAIKKQKPSVVVLLYGLTSSQQDHRSWDFGSILKFDEIIFLPVMTYGQSSQSQSVRLPIVSNVRQIRSGSFFTYDPSASPMRLNWTPQEWRNMKDCLKFVLKQ